MKYVQLFINMVLGMLVGALLVVVSLLTHQLNTLQSTVTTHDDLILMQTAKEYHKEKFEYKGEDVQPECEDSKEKSKPLSL